MPLGTFGIIILIMIVLTKNFDTIEKQLQSCTKFCLDEISVHLIELHYRFVLKELHSAAFPVNKLILLKLS
jgi:hypothetical protein